MEKNIFDYIDPDILSKLEALEKEEEERLEALDKEREAALENDDPKEWRLSKEEEELYDYIKNEKEITIDEHRRNKLTRSKNPTLPRTAKKRTFEEFENHLKDLGIDSSQAAESVSRSQSRSKSRARSVSRSRSESRGRKKLRKDATPPSSSSSPSSRSRVRSTSVSRSVSKTPNQLGFADTTQQKKAGKLVRNSQKERNHEARKGEGDRVILNMMPKHLFSGKRGMGKNDRR